MRTTNVEPNSLPCTALLVGLASVSILRAGTNSWEEEAVRISRRGGETAVRLIMDQHAGTSLHPDERGHAFVPFRARGGWQLVPRTYNRGHDHVRVIVFGTPVWSWREEGGAGRQTLPVVFDGRNARHACGIEGGLLLVTGAPDPSCRSIDSRGAGARTARETGGGTANRSFRSPFRRRARPTERST